MSLRAQVQAAATALSSAVGGEMPEVAIVLGSGFKGFEEQLEERRVYNLASLPGSFVPKVQGHGAQLVIGRLGGKRCAVYTGRVHLYEGFTPHEVVMNLRAAIHAGVKRVLLTNAVGSLDVNLPAGTIVACNDQINLTGASCLIGAGELGPMFVDMCDVFDPKLVRRLSTLDGVRQGVFIGCIGPAYETRSEVAMMRALGGHIVGMSLIQEALACRQLNIPVAALSFVTNLAGGLGGAVSHAEVLAIGAASRDRLYATLRQAAQIVLEN